VARIVPDGALDEEHKYFIDDISQIPNSFHRRIAAKELDKIITFWCNCRFTVLPHTPNKAWFVLNFRSVDI
jgi:hypothetical protein